MATTLKPAPAPPTLVEGLLQSPARFIDGGFTYLTSSNEPLHHSYAQTLQRAQRILAGLQSLGLTAGDKLVLHFAACENFIPAIWATLLGGIIPVAVGKHDGNPHYQHLTKERLFQICHLLRGSRILTDAPEEVGQAGKDFGFNPRRSYATWRNPCNNDQLWHVFN